jgi:hypothetical protein
MYYKKHTGGMALIVSHCGGLCLFVIPHSSIRPIQLYIGRTSNIKEMINSQP